MKALKTLALCCLSALVFVGCDPNSGNEGYGSGDLILTADKYEIYDNGEDVTTFTLTYKGEVVTEGYTIYDEDANPIEGNTFASTKPGVYKFWAEYGAVQTMSDTSITVITTPPAAPAVPTDSNPSKLDFKRRVLLVQFTGTGCQYCPNMINALYNIKNDNGMIDNFKNDIVISAAHIGPFAGDDPAEMTDGKSIDDAFGITGYPNLVVDLVVNKEDVYANAAYVKSMIKKALQRVNVKGGIAVNAEYHADKNYVMLNTLVKAKETTEFRVGAFLLEDNIYGAQSFNSAIERIEGINYNYHNNCIRRVRCLKPGNDFDFSGYDLGTIEAGKTASYEFAFPLLKTWNAEKLHLVVFISTKEEGGKWHVNNVIDAPINGLTDFEYNN